MIFSATSCMSVEFKVLLSVWCVQACVCFLVSVYVSPHKTHSEYTRQIVYVIGPTVLATVRTCGRLPDSNDKYLIKMLVIHTFMLIEICLETWWERKCEMILSQENNSQRHMLFSDLFSLEVSTLPLRHHLGIDKYKD